VQHIAIYFLVIKKWSCEYFYEKCSPTSFLCDVEFNSVFGGIQNAFSKSLFAYLSVKFF
jgi:hypothetical protein